MTEGTIERVSLREALGAPADPEFSLHLPPGWERRPVTDEERDRLIAGTRKRLMEQHRPELFGQIRASLLEAFANLARAGAVGYFAPAEDAPDAAFLPASLTASVLTPPVGLSMDEVVVSAIRERGATPLHGDKRFVRFEQRQTLTEGTSRVVAGSVVYLTPIPGTARRRALQLTLTLFWPAEGDDDAEELRLLRALFDACVSTLSWHASTD
ncbi:hypothetical protein [Agrococcus citreus]|uniref:Uncharacterized protein n=1 Tax=Agrococcus citreus TaxID=84643 RepID=A0ABN1YWZ5_9MICO